MTGSVLDILIYVFDRYMLDEVPEVPEREDLARQLEGAGFAHKNVERALDWLADLACVRDALPLEGSGPAVRMFCEGELSRLSTECRGFLLTLERLGILSPQQREVVIERMLALDTGRARHRAAQVGRADGAVEPAGPGTCVRTAGRSGRVTGPTGVPH